MVRGARSVRARREGLWGIGLRVDFRSNRVPQKEAPEEGGWRS
jgi:hypothetical protein